MKRHLVSSALLISFVVLVGFLAKSALSASALAPSAPALPPVPVSKNLPPPAVSARDIFILDMDSQQVLYEKGADEQVYPASTTKMMTALVALNYYTLDQTITVTQSFPEGQNAGLVPGERLTVEQLLYTMLVDSANDAAEILAQNYPGGRAAFVGEMNVMASHMHLYHTHFVNPTGLDEDGHYSSAADLTRLAQAVLTHPLLAKIVSTQNAVIATNTTPHVLTNLNALLGTVPGVLGVKTGFTDLAGQALVTYIDRQNHPLIITVLGSTDRFGDTESLIRWVYSDFTWSTAPSPHP